jgi:hypothetical protein
MTIARLAAVGLICTLPLAASADITAGDLPTDTIWYLHADLEALRDSEGGSVIYREFEKEGAEDIKEELGIDISAEVNSVTAFANAADGTVVVVEGPITKDTQDKIMAIAVTEGGDVDPREYDGKTYYHFGDASEEGPGDSEPFEDLEESAYVSFAINGKAIVTAREAQMQSLLENDGRITGMGNHDGALLVMSANNTLVQAGLQTDGLIDTDDGDWESNIVRNTRQAALLVADDSGMIAIEAQLVSRDPKMAQAIGGIVNGLIGLQALNGDLEPELQNLLRNTKVNVRENILSISTVLDPNTVISAID